jgi:phosphatidate cytidylyltransferase
MIEQALWQSTFYVRTVTSVVAFFFVVGAIVYFLQRRDPKWISVWASIKSWVITSPIIFFFAALHSPWPFVFVVLVAIFGAKTFFRMTGMYHRSWFVWLTYIFILIQGYLIYNGHDRFFNIMPMLFLAATCLIPILRNSYTQMIQYIALSLINFIIMGWGFMHMGRIVLWENGPLIALYLMILFEFCEATNYAITRAFGKHKPIGNITSRFSIEGFLGSLALTLLLAWGLRYMLPDRSEIYWATCAISVAIFGRLGGLTLSVIRRDLNIKESGIFIIGRDDILSRIDKPMFAAPLIYYAFLAINGTYSL